MSSLIWLRFFTNTKKNCRPFNFGLTFVASDLPIVDMLSGTSYTFISGPFGFRICRFNGCLVLSSGGGENSDLLFAFFIVQGIWSPVRVG